MQLPQFKSSFLKRTDRWPHDLGRPFDPLENVIRYRAQSALTGIEMRDGSGAPILPVEYARDVVRWSERGGWML
jgi:hypothetical protein